MTDDLEALRTELTNELTAHLDEQLTDLRARLAVEMSADMGALKADLQLAVARHIDSKIQDIKAAIPPGPDLEPVFDALTQLEARNNQLTALVNKLASDVERYRSTDRYTLTRAQVVRIMREEKNNG